MSESLPSEEMTPCGVCWQMTDAKKSACLACTKFFARNRHRNLNELDCQSGTNNCHISDSNSVQISTGATWRMACRKCRLKKCFEVCSSPEGSTDWSSQEETSGSPNSNSNERPEKNSMAKAANETIAMFELTYQQWKAQGSRVTLANMLSATIIEFSRHIKGFSELPEQIQLRFCYQAAPLISLVLSHNSKKVNGDSQFLSSIFRDLPDLRKQFQMADQFRKWQPTPSEIGMTMQVILCKNCYGNVSHEPQMIAGVVKGIDQCIDKEISIERKANFLSIISFIFTIL